MELSVQELKKYDGKQHEKIYVALAGNVYDVTEKGKSFYGSGSPYAMLAGRDASRAMATMSMDNLVMETYDKLSDLNKEQRERLDYWRGQFQEKYTCVGSLVPK